MDVHIYFYKMPRNKIKCCTDPFKRHKRKQKTKLLRYDRALGNIASSSRHSYLICQGCKNILNKPQEEPEESKDVEYDPVVETSFIPDILIYINEQPIPKGE